MVVEAVEALQMEEEVVLITYGIDAVKEIYALNPNIMLSVSARNLEEIKRLEATGIPNENFIAFTGTRVAAPEVYETLHQKGILCILGTMGNLDQQAKAKGYSWYQTYLKKGADVLATDFPEQAKQGIASFER